MGITTFDGPLGTFGQGTYADYNSQIGPSFWYQGDMVLDPRLPFTYQPGQRADQPTYGWFSANNIPIIDQVPSTASATNIASATPSSGTALTLVTSSGSGITVGETITNAATGQSVTGLLGIDVAAARTATGTFTNGSPKITFTGVVPLGVQVGDILTLTSSGTLPTPFALLTNYYVNAIGNGALMLSAASGGPAISASTAGSGTQTLNFTVSGPQPAAIFGPGTGSGGPIHVWNPAWALSRCIVVTSNGVDTSGTYSIKGFDVYGYPMSQTLTGTSSSTATTTKAFKYIQSVTPNGTIGSTTLEVGTVDVFGLPLRTDWPEYLTMYWNSAAIVAGTTGSSTFVGADITTPTALTGDVRGTVYGGSASDGTKRMYLFWNPQSANMNSTVGLLGQTQF